MSYSHDSKAHQLWVRQVTDDLFQNGVDVFFDQTSVGGGDHIGLSIEEAMQKADVFICILTPEYKIKADQRTNWVGREIDIYNSLEQAEKNQLKIIPILRKGSMEEGLPLNMRNRAFIDMTKDDTYEEKFKELISQIFPDLKSLPKRGKKPNKLGDIRFGKQNNEEKHTYEFKNLSGINSRIVCIHGYEESGKTLTALRLCTYLKRDFGVLLEKDFCLDTKYFQEIDSYRMALKEKVTRIDKIDCEVPLFTKLIGSFNEDYYIMDIPWHDTFNYAEGNGKADYLDQLYNSPSRRVNIFLFDYKQLHSNKSYIEILTLLISRKRIKKRDQTIILISKADQSHNLMPNGTPITSRFDGDIKRNPDFIELLKVFKINGHAKPRIIPFSVFDEKQLSKLVQFESLDYYPKSLWRAINREIMGVKKSWFF